jgi:hypothetical protein
VSLVDVYFLSDLVLMMLLSIEMQRTIIMA